MLLSSYNADGKRIKPRSRRERRQQIIERRLRRRRFYLSLSAVFVLILIFISPLVKQPVAKRKKAAAQPPLVQPGHVQKVSSIGLFPFAKVQGTDLMLYLPASVDEIYGIGYHQAYNPRSYGLEPSVNFLQGDQIKGEVRAKTNLGHPLSFVMASRGRRSSATSSADVALRSGSVITAPVDGTIADIVSYQLYGRQNDYRIEITAKGHPEFKIAIVHIDDIMVTKGQKVIKGVTRLARVRRLSFKSQIDDYIAYPQDHVHIQVNPINAGEKVFE